MLQTGAFIAVSGGFAAVVVAIAMSVWRSREFEQRPDLRLGAVGGTP
jgi:hypothetical protein